ncbi:hypothetical protein BJX64DRAFT_249843 [Aspergillus heterothallicus]
MAKLWSLYLASVSNHPGHCFILIKKGHKYNGCELRSLGEVRQHKTRVQTAILYLRCQLRLMLITTLGMSWSLAETVGFLTLIIAIPTSIATIWTLSRLYRGRQSPFSMQLGWCPSFQNHVFTFLRLSSRFNRQKAVRRPLSRIETARSPRDTYALAALAGRASFSVRFYVMRKSMLGGNMLHGYRYLL